MDVSTAVKQRISTRAFLDTPLSQSDIAEWLKSAQRAPSGGNMQPWRIIAVAGEARQEIVDLATEIITASPKGEPTDRPMYPEYLPEDQVEMYMDRRRAVAFSMYELLGIGRKDREARAAWNLANYTFFGAPVGLFVVIDEHMGHGQWGHTGMFLQTLALLAEERGWATCMQECWATLRPSLKAHLGLKETEMVWCGMAVGFPDKTAPVNQLCTERAKLEEFAEFRGFP